MIYSDFDKPSLVYYEFEITALNSVALDQECLKDVKFIEVNISRSFQSNHYDNLTMNYRVRSYQVLSFSVSEEDSVIVDLVLGGKFRLKLVTS